jgi:polyhydroxybutyrate depolymerase
MKSADLKSARHRLSLGWAAALAAGLLISGAAYQSVCAENLPPVSTSIEGTLNIGKQARHYYVHVPPHCDGKTALPLVIMLHGGGGNHYFAERMTRLSEKADKEGFIVVYPDGTGRLKANVLTWNAIDCCGYAKARRIDDVRFLSQLIDRMHKDFNIDEHRVYVMGFSNGAMMVHVVAAELSGKIAAVASVGGSMSGKEPQPTHPVPMLIIHGSADKHVPFNGGPGKLAKWGFPVNKEPVSYAIDFWVKANGCSTIPEKTQQCPTVERIRYSGGKEDSEVVLYILDGAKHQWAGGKRAWVRADRPFPDLSATDTCWEFFSKHERKIVDESRAAYHSGDSNNTASQQH